MKSRMLTYIGKKTSLVNSFKTTTTKIGCELEISQQSVSRILKILEDEGMIKREINPNGMIIKIKEKGRSELDKEYKILKEIMEGPKKISGKIFKGYGQGSYYVKKYMAKLKKILEYEPYLGTLNVKVNPDEAESFLQGMKPIMIEKFSGKDRNFGGVKLYKVLIEGLPGAIIIPERSNHGNNVLEIIGETNFRSGLNKNEDDKVEIIRDGSK